MSPSPRGMLRWHAEERLRTVKISAVIYPADEGGSHHTTMEERPSGPSSSFSS